MKPDNFYHLGYSVYCFQLHYHTHNISTDIPSAFLRGIMSNSEADTELWTELFIIKPTGVDCSNSVNYDWVQALSYSKYYLSSYL